MRIIFLLIITSIISLNLYAQNRSTQWILVATNKIGGKTFISSNINSKANGIIKLWSKEVNEKLDSLANLHYQPVNFIEVDCNLHRMKLDSGSLYDSKGKLIFKNSYNEKWDSVTKGSTGDLIIQKVCLLFNK